MFPFEKISWHFEPAIPKLIPKYLNVKIFSHSLDCWYSYIFSWNSFCLVTVFPFLWDESNISLAATIYSVFHYPHCFEKQQLIRSCQRKHQPLPSTHIHQLLQSIYFILVSEKIIDVWLNWITHFFALKRWKTLTIDIWSIFFNQTLMERKNKTYSVNKVTKFSNNAPISFYVKIVNICCWLSFFLNWSG